MTGSSYTDRIDTAYQAGTSLAAIAADLGTGRRAVSHWMGTWNIRRRTREETGRLFHQPATSLSRGAEPSRPGTGEIAWTRLASSHCQTCRTLAVRRQRARARHDPTTVAACEEELDLHRRAHPRRTGSRHPSRPPSCMEDPTRTEEP
ncbi:hypothetical protein LN042_23140 [Kitasatospora sp. RB6PN24]|uniref:hypothetical protein n=1 Tax=Kitasatospora humi TaxID=2893891 RepID=UPI001E3729B6|nr:hypothetical protein [Kitasatospora humi]MCC9309932.1 hypothetical protein [Kitasatospora humi]